jgi:tetratricopeptide (TPR) repeat protein
VAGGDGGGGQVLRTVGVKPSGGALGEGRWAVAEQPALSFAGLLLLLAKVLDESGDLERAETVLGEASQAAAAAGLPVTAARVRVLLAQFSAEQGGSLEEAWQECEAATAILAADGDLAGLADAWVLAGMLRYWLGAVLACPEALERAAAYARQSGNHYAEKQARLWLAISFSALPVPADLAVSRVEQLLGPASGDPWGEVDILMWLALLYGYAGRFADARRAAARGRPTLTEMGAKIQWAALCAEVAGQIELIAGDPAAAEHHIRDAYQALRAIGERINRANTACLLAEAVYAQGRFGEAEQLAGEARELLLEADAFEPQARWRAAKAKLLARRGEFAAARRLADEAEALVSPTSYAALLAEVLVAKAEVNRLAGAPDQAEASLRTALGIYHDRRAVPLAERTRAAMASLAAHPTTGPA